jgi:predicted RNase H-like HicB family nuclease
MRFPVIMEKDEDGIYVVTVPALPGCISDGRTVEEAISNIREAIRGFIDDMNADGEPIPHDIDIIGNIELNA